MEFDPIETCPYDNIHRIRRSRMQFHIRRCSKNFSNSDKMQCPFDARHIVNQVDFEYHVDHCPAREFIIDYSIDHITQVEQNILPINVDPVRVSDAEWGKEKWDEAADFQAYSPLQTIQDKPIVYPIIGLSKAKRRKHRMQERIRYNQIMENGGSSMQTNLLSVDNVEDEQEEKPLRRPYHIGNKINGAPQNKNQNFMPPKLMKIQLTPKKSVNNKEAKKECIPLQQPQNIANNSNSAPKDKNQNFTPSKDSKELQAIDNKTSNVPLNHATVQSKSEERAVLNNSKDSDSIIDKLSKTFEEIAVKDKSYKEKTEQLDKEINNWKLVSSKRKTKQIRTQK